MPDANRDLLAPDLATRGDLALVKQELRSAIENVTLRVTAWFGVILAAGLSRMTAILGALLRFH